MKALRIVAFALGGVVALLAAVAVFLVATFDANKWKGEIAQLVQEKKARSLRIEGELALSLFPSIGVSLGRTTLSEHKSEQVFAAVDMARVSLRLLPLLSKQVVVDTVELEGLKARIVRFKDGRLNIDDLMGKDDKEPTPRFDIAGVKLAGGELAWRDEKAGQEVALSGVNLTTGRLANAASDRFSLEARLAGSKPKLAAALKAAGEYRYDLDRKRYGGTKLDLRLSGDVADMKALELALAAAALQLAGANELAIDQLVLTAKGKEAGDAFEARLALSGVEGKSPSLQAGKLTLDLDARQGETTLKGSLASVLSTNLDKQTVELPAFKGELNVAHPQMPMKSVKLPLAGGLRADIDGQTAALHADTQFDESRIAAKVNVSRYSPLALVFDIDIDRLNVDKYLPPDKGASGAKGAADKPIDFSPLRGLNANGTVKIGQLQVANVKAANVRLEVKAANSRLDVATAGATVAAMKKGLGGTASVNLRETKAVFSARKDAVVQAQQTEKTDFPNCPPPSASPTAWRAMTI